MGGTTDLGESMQVYGAGDRRIGRVARIHSRAFDVAGRHYQRDTVKRVDDHQVSLRGRAADDGEIRVPVVGERLSVGTREVELGEVEVRRRVVEEQQSVPVSLRPGEDAFNEGSTRVPVHGEEAVIDKEAVVTGEVVVNKATTAEERTVSETVRRTEVDFDERYQRARGDFERHHASTVGAQGGAFEEHEPHYRTGFMTGADQRYAGREFEDVEPELRQGHETTGGGGWERLREQVHAGFDRARA